MRTFYALMRAAEALGQASDAEAALPHGRGSALREPLKSAIAERRAAEQKLARTALSYYRAKRRLSGPSEGRP